jgi:hypothetical protein
MPITRLFPRLGQVIINRFNQAAGPRADQVSTELNNIINNGINKLTYVFAWNTDIVGNTGAGLDSLITIPIPAETLANNNDMMTIIAGGSLTFNNNAKRVVLRFGAASPTFYDPFGITHSGGAPGFGIGWFYYGEFIRTSPTNLRQIYTAREGQSNVNNFATAEALDITVPNLDTNQLTYTVLGESAGAANNDVTHSYTKILITRNT